MRFHFSAFLRLMFAAGSIVGLMSTASYAQTITITFEGTLNGTAIPLDSILVMNLTGGGDTTIHFPDHVLVLDGTVGMAPVGRTPLAMQGIPNPFAGSTEVELATTAGELTLALHDPLGRLLTSYSVPVAEGMQRFRVVCGQPGVHLLSARQAAGQRTLRLLANEGGGGPALEHLGMAVHGHGTAKDARALFSWAAGDMLRYIGYATDAGVVHSAVIDEVPESSATRTFELLVGMACPGSPTVTDIEGNVYRTVQIGGHCWMAENLRTATFADGTPIPNETGDTAWAELGTAAWCNYQNNASHDTTYGKLYNWWAAGNPGICPQGWHVPSDAEWTQLSDHLGGVVVAGGKMKTTTLWNAPNTGATNESGFSGLPGGNRYFTEGYFELLGNIGYWWSISENGTGYAWHRALRSYNAGLSRGYNDKRSGYCLRCIED